jgi:hypothetical protein
MNAYLRGIAPPLEVRAHGPHGRVDAELLADQIAHGAAVPQGGRDAQVFGAVVVEERLDVAGLLIGQQAPGAEGASGPLLRQRVRPLRGVGRPPTAHRLARDPEQVRDVGFGEARLAAAQGAQAECLKDVIGQQAGVRQGDGHDTFPSRILSASLLHPLYS